ncbi:translation elongation factor 4 [Candidatus Purcelliella pentastirinorum]|uniref:Elongation factor 4 n=1 Tax=Candidatus Purcelliella pentastirinorum TaxID=472834 RepID=A0AAX3N771_9ENTR|nr:translation elongation factor 4 [Candidatus Purcelliella pentastirinorum]WDI78414.1 translation elongation factor 4 [Candidatus Purcelliella pentastirinorum]
MKYIRNFSIIAHIDHGKSTLSNKLIQICNKNILIKNKILHSMELEKERGITIKANCINLNYTDKNKNKYKLNLIDTPGHVDFSYEVSRSISACEGAILLIDASQGIEAQTISNYQIATKMKLKIIIVINKIDLKTANIKKVTEQIKNTFHTKNKKIFYCSAKIGYGIKPIIKEIIKEIPRPNGNKNKPLQALVIDSKFDKYQGIISLIKIKNGNLKIKDIIQVMSTRKKYKINKIIKFNPKEIEKKKLHCGEVGWIFCGTKDIESVPVGDTITKTINPAKKKLKNFKKIKPQVYAKIFPIKQKYYKNLEIALKKLKLNDSALIYEIENSSTLGAGFKCGFLGLLHMEIIKERIKREYNINIINTLPSVVYRVKTFCNKIIYLNNPKKFNSIKNIKYFQEPFAECIILLNKKYLGKIIKLCNKRRGIQTNISYHNDDYIILKYEIPMIEIIFDFYNNIKSISHGYASIQYSFKEFKNSNMVYIEILINKINIDILSTITHRSNAQIISKKIIDKIIPLISRTQFDIIIQAQCNKKIIISKKIKQLRKNVIAKCYGGDITRKKKLLKKQKKGKKKMKQIGNINIPKDVFLSILNINHK